MNLNETIQSIETHLGEAYASLEEMGATIPDKKNIENLADTTLTIPKGGDVSEYFYEGGHPSGTSNCGRWFEQIKKMPPATINTGLADNYFYNFRGEELDITRMDFSFVSSASNIFNNCINLKSIKGIENVDSSKFTTISSMFYNCNNLLELDLSKWNTPALTNMNYAFYGCKALKTLKIDNFDISKVTGMSQLFYNCNELETLNLGNFQNDVATDYSSMFGTCRKLKNLTLTGLTGSSVKNTSSMFTNCNALETVDLSNFASTVLDTISNMFSYCTSLQRIDIRNMDFSKVSSYTGAFGSSSASRIPADCLIIVKGDTQKNWILNRFSFLTNIKTVAELGE